MKKSFYRKLTFTALAAVVALTACEKSPYPGYEKSESGLYSKFYSHDEKGVKPLEGDMVKVVMLYKNDKDSVLFDSKDPRMNHNGDGTIEFALAKSSFSGSFEEALGTMSVGDSASFIISADSVYLKTFAMKELPPHIKKGSMLTFQVALKKITAKDEVEKKRKEQAAQREIMMSERKAAEEKERNQYLADHKITAKPTADGLYYIEKTKGKGPKATKGMTVKLNYTGMLLDGKIFDTSDEGVAKKANIFNEQRTYTPIEFPLGSGQVIPGWEEAISMMSPGAKATFIIPSSIAYGEQGGGPIPPYSTLVFDVELISATAPTPEQLKQQQMQQMQNVQH